MHQDPWRPARNGMQMAFFAWLVNACSGLLVGAAFTTILSASMSGGGTDSDWKLLDRLGVMASFTDLAAMTIVAIGMLLLARAPAPARPGGPATGAFVCALVSMAVSFLGFVDQILGMTKLADGPILEWEVGKYVYAVDGLAFTASVVLFVVALLNVGGALGARDAAWKGIVALVAISVAVLLSTVSAHVLELRAFRMENRWAWFLVTRGLRGLGDVMLLLFLAHLFRASRSHSPPSPGRSGFDRSTGSRLPG